MPLVRRILKPLLCIVFITLLAGCQLLNTAKDEEVFSVAFVSEQGLSLYQRGSEPTLLWEGKNLHRPCFSQDGQYIFFNESSDLFCYSLAEGKRVLAAKNAKAMGFDSKGRLLSLSPSKAAAYDPSTGESEVLYTPPNEHHLAAYLPSPDEMRVAYTIYREDAGQKIPKGFFVTIPGSEELLSFSAEEISGKRLYLPIPLAWATDGSALLVAAGPGTGGPASLFVVPITDGAPVPLSKKHNFLLEEEANIYTGGGQALIPVLKNEDDAFISLLQVDLFSFTFSIQHSSTSMLTGLDLSADGSMVAVTAENAGLFTLWSGKTAQIAVSSPGETLYSPVFSKDRQRIFVLRQKEGQPADFCVAAANSAGLTELFSGVLPPDTSLGQTFAHRFSIFEPETE